MSRNIQTVTKWMPAELQEKEIVFKGCNELKKKSLHLSKRVCETLQEFKSKIKFHSVHNEINVEDLEGIASDLEKNADCFSETFNNLTLDKIQSELLADKIKMWKDHLWKVKLQLCYFLQKLITEIAYLFVYRDVLLKITLKISLSYNNFISMDSKFGLVKNPICNNTCPYLFQPLKKISVTRLLQIIAADRSELCCHKLIDSLLETYKMYDNFDDTSSDNSSEEIYRALTKHLSPPGPVKKESKNPEDGNETFESIEELIENEEKNVLELLDGILTLAPSMLGNDGVRKSKIAKMARQKVLEYYEQILWGEVGNFLEHIILWWANSPLSARSPHSSQHLREWITQFIPSAGIPTPVLSALSSLADGLGVHVALTSWDQHFRLALVASKTYNPETGKLFCQVLQDLVMLCNQCEITPDWIVGAPLDELPLVEQIPVLHRLDHSIHTTRLWAVNETKKLANNWSVDSFFMVTHCDVINCLSQLNSLRLTNHTVAIEKGGLGVHVQVCASMRAKLVSEVEVNRDKLKETPNQCVKSLADVCRTISLANLQMIFPDSLYWKRIGCELPSTPSHYVDKYLEQILTPILAATDDPLISNMILQIMCQSWLDHIYMNRIKFSQFGACQLLCDFGYVEKWLVGCSIINQNMKKKMLRNEVLRRCEGVGRLLLRCPGEQIKMVDKKQKTADEAEKSPSSENNQQMPAEMYVPNQEQWLELRATKKNKFFINPLCCGKF